MFGESEKIIGFNLDSDKIHFGKVPRNAVSSKRFITVTNGFNYGVDVLLGTEGELGEWLYSEIKENNETFIANYFYLAPNESREVTFYLIPPEEAEVDKKYEGAIRFVIMRHKLFG